MIYNSEDKTITTERLLLRLFLLSDAETVMKHCNNFNVYKSTLTLPYPYPLECAISWIQSHEDNFDTQKSYEFAITDKESGEIYGCIGITNNQKYKNGEVGYWVGEEYWGKGYGSESLKAIIDFAFLEKQYHKVYARHFASNPASGRVMQKAGMQYEGKQIDQVFKENKFETIVHYGMLNN